MAAQYEYLDFSTKDVTPKTPLTKRPIDCLECVNSHRPENCNRRCSVLSSNHGYRSREVYLESVKGEPL